MNLLDLLSILYGILLSFLGVFLPSSPTQPLTSSTLSSSTPSVLVENIATTTKTKTEKVIVKKESVPVVQNTIPVIPSTSSISSIQTQKESLYSIESLNQKARSALVNIFCTTKRDGDVKPITASGVIISPEGVILTNAHVAQYYLLEDYRETGFINCTIRTGSPASDKYKAKLLYISPLWIEANKKMITAEKQVGTGENDFAFLLISQSTDGSALPTQFPYLSLEQDDENIMNYPETDYLLTGYPAGFLGGSAITKDLYQISTVGRINKALTFHEDTLDLLSFGGSILAQRGASGGAAISARNAKVAGIIVTTTEAKNTADRDLHLLTGSHIGRSFKMAADLPLTNFLNGNLELELEYFRKNIAPGLTLDLVSELERRK